MHMDLNGRKITIMGLGRHGGGAGAARFAARQGGIVTVTDLASRAQLADSLAALDEESIECFHLGEHRADDFTGCDVLVVNASIRPDHPLVQSARAHGARVASELQWFLEACPAQVVGVTGTNGKSTTATMLAQILRHAGRRCFLGGNLGGSLLDDVHRMQRDDFAVVEMSSFQLMSLAADTPLPSLAIITGFAPNHLDWHRDLQEYERAKQRLLRGPHDDSVVVFDTQDPALSSWRPIVRRRLESPVSDAAIPPLNVPGRHNRANARLAAAAAALLGCDQTTIESSLQHFSGLPHRLEYWGERRGRRIYNDSQATTPGSTVAALEALVGPLWLLVGGKDKGGDYTPLVEQARRCTRGVACFGSARGQLGDYFRRIAFEGVCEVRESLPAAVEALWPHMSPGDALVLSPACSSLDQFRDYADRAAAFRQIVEQLAAGE
ncbi:MAG: UDP-N-acetylmuramoyl-L-alanine--D-glutamate ligase [Planctomycetales bacterium]|nr:UDP-N-acetylmuramoyl-L-alanine--D-glutamate ligase [Planctomycetales bacterium]